MNQHESKVGVFIIESLSFKNEKNELLEGRMLSDVLNISQIENEYYYIRTTRELQEVANLFHKSGLRYLHISCHGADKAISLTLNDVPYLRFGAILQPYIEDRRIFMSACSSVNHHIAAAIIPKGQCYSIIGPTGDIEFREAGILWSSFYHLMFKTNSKYMVREDLIKNIQKIVNAFEVPMTFYSSSVSKGIKKKAFNVQTTKTSLKESTQIK